MLLKEEYSALVFFSIIGLIVGAAYIYIHFKETIKNSYFLISAIIWFLFPVFTVIGMLLDSERIIYFAFLFPTAIFAIVTSLEHFIRYKRCTRKVSAKCVSFYTIRRKFSFYTPRFSYDHNGETILAQSFLLYSKGKINKLFEINGTYDIFINPKNPKQCVDKRYFPKSNIVLLICGIIFFVIILFMLIFS